MSERIIPEEFTVGTVRVRPVTPPHKNILSAWQNKHVSVLYSFEREDGRLIWHVSIHNDKRVPTDEELRQAVDTIIGADVPYETVPGQSSSFTVHAFEIVEMAA